MTEQGRQPVNVDQSESFSVDNDGRSTTHEENSPSLHDSYSGGQRSKSSSDGNDMYEIMQTGTKTLRKWRIVVFVILFCTFSSIIASIYILIKKEYQDDDEEAVSENYLELSLQDGL
jgi:hypothetical protein